MTFHDWVHVPPLTDIRELEKHSSYKGRLINSALFALWVLIPLGVTWWNKDCLTRSVLSVPVVLYSILTVGTIFSWWVPYFFGSSDEHKAHFAEYKTTHHFLPKRGTHVVPNTFHVFLHSVIWTCWAFSVYLFFQVC